MRVQLEKTYIYKGRDIIPAHSACEVNAFAGANGINSYDYHTGTMCYKVLSAHNTTGNNDKLQLKFDALTSHDITYVGIIQTARASGLTEFPVPYALTNCHNSLCAVGGTLNEDDHLFGLSAAKKYGGIYVPPHIAVIHSYAREVLAGCGKMVLGSDSHTRYGALGCMAVGEGGPELVKQLLKRTYDINYPDVVAVRLTGSPIPGVGPHDVALALIKAVFAGDLVKNKVLEFIGEGVNNLSVDFRSGIDVMTTETKCLSSVWMTDDKVKRYYQIHKRPDDFAYMEPDDIAEYDGIIDIDLSEIRPMIALPFHPSNAYTIKEFNANAKELLSAIEQETVQKFGKTGVKPCLVQKYSEGSLFADQGVIAGCAGGIFENIMAACDILRGKNAGNAGFALNVYPASQSVYFKLLENGGARDLMEAGAVLKTSFCGPCFGAGDVPSNNGFSLRHTTRNFPNREGSKPGEGQISYCALMDARSIAATAANGGKLTGADELDVKYCEYEYTFNDAIYNKRVYNGWGNPDKNEQLIIGPNITDWPKLEPMPDNLLIRLCSVIRDPVTTTDELIPSGEISTLRSNPYKLSEYTLSRRDPEYVGKAKAVRSQQEALIGGKQLEPEYAAALKTVKEALGVDSNALSLGSAVFANMPGDGSAREQAASCQKVLGGWANIALEYATKRYRSNLINWGLVPLLIDEDTAEQICNGDFILLYNVRNSVLNGEKVTSYIIKNDMAKRITLLTAPMTDDEKDILTDGGLINYYANSKKHEH